MNWGIIGLGSIAKEFAKGFKDLKSAKLIAIASNDKDKINNFKKCFEISKEFCFDNYQNLLDEKKIDIIYIALPTFLHKKWIINCLIKNKNVLVEKPAVMNSKEILEVKKYYKNKNYFFEAYMYLFHPQIIKTFDLIRQGEIGEILSMESYFGNNILTKKNWLGLVKKKRINPQNRLFNKEMGGGAILDLGCYPVSFSSQIASLKSPVSIDNINCTNKTHLFGSTGVEIDSQTVLKFGKNFTSKIGASFIKNLGRKSEITGSKGKIIIEDTWTANPAKIILKKKNSELIFNFDKQKSIYSHEIESISQFLLKKHVKDIQIFTLDASILNTQIIDAWKNDI